ncbi:hypothetical protein BHYA_0206g00130 [Botrytis hyacinthi]|uniref:Uncharacterized protein n=1 Tax=Botrytis hyacinthi TaxID=278943 RepID=A0A4Z1GFP1_9HELO|nr:hypothetical protein BHYA_0206g00130 [Botrytis hyacinthi]
MLSYTVYTGNTPSSRHLNQFNSIFQHIVKSGQVGKWASGQVVQNQVNTASMLRFDGDEV